MFGKGKNKKTARIDTLIGAHSEVVGDVTFSGGLHIDGTVKGNIVGNDKMSLVQLSEEGTIEGEVKAPFVTLNGVVIGDVHGYEHVELSSKARVTGNVYYGLIEMEIGTEVNGQLVHTEPVEELPSALDDMDTNDHDG